MIYTPCIYNCHDSSKQFSSVTVVIYVGLCAKNSMTYNFNKCVLVVAQNIFDYLIYFYNICDLAYRLYVKLEKQQFNYLLVYWNFPVL